MNLLKAALYDPAVAVSKATSALLAMTAFDTTNLRLAVTVPAHGMVRFRLRCNLTGATTSPTILLGVLNGATVVGRVIPTYENATANAATQSFVMDAEFTATGLVAGAANFDAAYAVQVLVASTNIKYGGPNTNAGANAWGAFVFEAWDPQPQTTTGQLAVDANGRVDVSKVAGTAQTARDLGLQLDATVSSRSTYAGGAVASVTAAVTLPAIPANWITAAGITAAALNGKGDWSTYAGGDTAGTTSLLARLTAGRATNLDNLDAAVSSRSTYAGADTAGTTTLVGRLTALRAAGLDFLDAAISTRFAAASYAAPDNASIASILARTDVATSTRAAAGDAMALTVAERASVADKLLGRNVSGGSDAGRLVKEALAVLRNKVSVAAGVLTVYDTDDATVLYTATVTTAPGDPIAAIDPA